MRGKELTQARRKMGLSILVLANILHVSPNLLSLMENGAIPVSINRELEIKAEIARQQKGYGSPRNIIHSLVNEGYSFTSLAREMNVKRTTIERWQAEQEIPIPQVLETLAKLPAPARRQGKRQKA